VIEADRLITAAHSPREREEVQDRAIRPVSLADYIGQPTVREQMELFIQAARGRNESLDHTLIFRPAGSGQDHSRQHHRPGNGRIDQEHLGAGA
jgi:Holliday junction DNA helicase RuvB